MSNKACRYFDKAPWELLWGTVFTSMRTLMAVEEGPQRQNVGTSSRYQPNEGTTSGSSSRGPREWQPLLMIKRRSITLSWVRCCLCFWLQWEDNLTDSEDEWDLSQCMSCKIFMTWIYSSLGGAWTGLPSLRRQRASGAVAMPGAASWAGLSAPGAVITIFTQGLSSQPPYLSPRSILFSV